MRITLIGMPAAGKTTLGKRLAHKLGYPFLDLDQAIVKCEGRSIPKIFAREGEVYFREKEAEMLKTSLIQENIILATGGGTPCFFDNMDFINAHSLSIWIDTPISLLIERIGRNSNRPLYQLDAEALAQKINKTYQERVIFYQQAKLVFR